MADEGDISDVAWIDDDLETITLVIDRIAITLSVDEFFQVRRDIEQVVKSLQESEEVQLCSYEDENKVTRYLLMRRTDGGEAH
jgi:hypothetical protein